MTSEPVARHFPADEYGNPAETLILTPSGEQYYVESEYEPPTLELTPRHRERLDEIKAKCKEADPGLPEPTDEQIVTSLLDTWDAVDEGVYAVPQEGRPE